MTDFGFARIASRNAEEMKRMTYCGTDVSSTVEVAHMILERYGGAGKGTGGGKGEGGLLLIERGT